MTLAAPVAAAALSCPSIEPLPLLSVCKCLRSKSTARACQGRVMSVAKSAVRLTFRRSEVRTQKTLRPGRPTPRGGLVQAWSEVPANGIERIFGRAVGARLRAAISLLLYLCATALLLGAEVNAATQRPSHG